MPMVFTTLWISIKGTGFAGILKIPHASGRATMERPLL
jgi:hypothetical protein